MIGFITLFASRPGNGVILIDHIRQLSNEGWRSSGHHYWSGERLILILMTGVGYRAGAGYPRTGGRTRCRDTSPMAVVILWGLFSSTSYWRWWCQLCIEILEKSAEASR